MKLRSLSAKLIAVAFVGVVGSILLLGWLAVDHGSRALLEQRSQALEAVRHSRQRYVESYFEIIRQQIFNFAQNEMIVEATRRFTTAFDNLEAELGGEDAALLASLAAYYENEFRPRLEVAEQPWQGLAFYLPKDSGARHLQALYLAANPHPVGRKLELEQSDAELEYDDLHAEYHPRIRDFLRSFGYYDIFLFDLEGNLVYSVFKETDFATNFRSGPYADTNLAEVFAAAAAAGAPGEVVVRDFASYKPSYGEPASFIAAPVFDADRKVGVAAFQMPVDKINEIMIDVAGLGETGETYLIGSDLRMRSDSRFGEHSTILTQVVETETARRALAGGSGVQIQNDYRGEPVLSSYGPLEIEGLEWAMLAEVDLAEALEPARLMRQRIGLLGALVAAVVCVATLLLLRRVVLEPVARLAAGARRVGEGDYSNRVETRSADELGDLARTFNEMTQTIGREIHEREQAELGARQAREAAEEANQAKSTFLASMSHELRTPMNAILGYSEMLIEETTDAGQAEFVPDLEKIHAAGKHLLALINSVLDLSKIESGKMEVYLETFDVATLVSEVEATIAAVVVKNRNELMVSCGPDLGEMRADLTKVRQALFNLLSNAAKFTEDGTVTLSVSREGEEGEERIRLAVSDTGIGIAPEKLDAVFEEFTQAESSTTRRFGGTGLGLAITKRFCEMLGGSVSVESELGVGTTFTIDLPAECLAGGEAVAALAEADPVATGRCILVIDDDRNARDLMERNLSRAGFVVATATSGEEGLEAARRLRPVAITLDVMMPGKDGWAVLRDLKSDPDLCEIPVVMVSMLEDRTMGLTLGAADYLTKPVNREQLARVLGRYRCDDPPCPLLVVEDDPEVREVLSRALQKEGWRVALAENGRAGLDCIEEVKPELILLDLMMPVMDGFEFLVELRRVEAWRTIPVVVVTAKDLTEEDRRRLDGSVATILAKGAYTQDELLAQIQQIVSSRSAAPDPVA